MNIKKNDTVIVLSGKSKGKKGKVLTAMPKENKLLVEGVNVATCHVKARKQNETSGIIKREIPIRADKVQLYCSTCKKAFASASSSTATRRSASARSAARKSEEEGRDYG